MRQPPHTLPPELESMRAIGTAEAAQLLGLSVRTLEGWRSRKVGPPFRRYPGGVCRYILSELVGWRDAPEHRP